MSNRFFPNFVHKGLNISVIFILGLLPCCNAGALTNLNVTLISNSRPSTNPLSYGDVWAENDLVCLGVWLNYSTYNYGVGIYTITNPASPVLLGVYSPAPTSQNQFELGAVRNRIGYFGSWSGGGLHIVSLTNPAAPALLCRVGATTGNVTNGFDRVHTIWLERNYLYEAAHVAGIVSVKVFDVSNPTVPVYLQDIVTTNTTKVHQITVRSKGSNTLLYTSGWGGNDNGDPNSPGQTDLWDVSSVGNQPAQWLGRVFSGYNSHSSYPSPDGNTLVVCRETPGGDVRLYDVSSPATLTSNTVPLVTLNPASMGLEADIPHNPVIIGNYLFVSWYQNGLQIFDISNRSRPVRIGFYDTFNAAQTSSFQGNWGVFPYLGFDRLLLSDIQSGLYILDASSVLISTNNYPPLIVNQPASLTVTQAATATFSAVATGSLLNYQWRFNGANLPGNSGSAIILTNVSPTVAGNYTVVVSNATGVITSSVASLSVASPQTFQTAFIERFDSPLASTNWNIYDGAANGVSDYTVDWYYDYSTYFSSFNGFSIPPAPNTTNGSTRGVKFTVNNGDASGVTAGVSIYPKSALFSGAYSLKFDMWINYPGGPMGSGAVGSTEHATFGINHLGTRVNWDSSSATPSDGAWFAMDGEGGTTTDYRAYAGNASANSSLLSFASSGFGAAGAASRDHTDPYWQSIFPSPIYETSGAPGKHWVQVEIGQDTNNVITWRINGNLIAQRTNTSNFTNGTIMLGYMDLFSSIASPAADAFVLFDNVRVETFAAATGPSIVAGPQAVSVYPGNDAAFSVAATGSAPLAFQWQFNGAAIPGATSNVFNRPIVRAEDVGYYSVVVSNTIGTAVSTNAFLSLFDSPYISAVQATPGERAALISWFTSVPGGSLVQYEAASTSFSGSSAASASAQAGFSQSSLTDPSLTTNHVVLLTGLSANTTYSFQVISPAGTNSYVSGVYQFRTAGDIIVDNPSAGFSGGWITTNASADTYGTNYSYAATVSGTNTALATFRPNITTPGKYDVYTWYPQGGNRVKNVPYTVSYNGGSVALAVNQQVGAGAWQLIASGLQFSTGTNGYVSIGNNANSGFVVADAVRFSYQDSQELTDGNNVPTWWQNFYFGNASDVASDPDGDGYGSGSEYVMGTSPTNNQSRFLFSGAQGTNGFLKFSFWPLLGNRSYQLLTRGNLGLSTWQDTGVAPSSAGDGHGEFAMAVTNFPLAFFRVKVSMTTNAMFPGSLAVSKSKSYSPLASDPICGPNRAYVR